jgi:transcriptional regulator with XRE-family HTH domain
MGAPKPALGYPSRTAAVHALREQGLSTKEIARRLQIKLSTVSALECGSGRACRLPRQSHERGRTIAVPIDVLNALSPHAAKRGIHVNSLARLIISTVVDDRMIDAVLDDADDHDWSAV